MPGGKILYLSLCLKVRSMIVHGHNGFMEQMAYEHMVYGADGL